jgi:hypothetical protein
MSLLTWLCLAVSSVALLDIDKIDLYVRIRQRRPLLGESDLRRKLREAEERNRELTVRLEQERANRLREMDELQGLLWVTRNLSAEDEMRK